MSRDRRSRLGRRMRSRLHEGFDRLSGSAGRQAEGKEWLAPRNPHKLYLDTEHAMFLGVCAGIADYFGVGRGLVRLLFVLGLIFFFPAFFIGYFVLGLALLKEKPAPLYENPQDEGFWRSVSHAPGETFHALRHRFRTLEARLSRLERHVTGETFDLNRRFHDLEREEGRQSRGGDRVS